MSYWAQLGHTNTVSADPTIFICNPLHLETATQLGLMSDLAIQGYIFCKITILQVANTARATTRTTRTQCTATEDYSGDSLALPKTSLLQTCSNISS